MKTHNTINARTHAEFLNELLHKQLKGYMQCRYNLDNGDKIWMIRLDGQQSKEGWTNSLVDSGNALTEVYSGSQVDRLPTHKIFPEERRLVFGIYERAYGDRVYMFHGVFEIDKSSTSNYRRWNKISDSYVF